MVISTAFPTRFLPERTGDAIFLKRPHPTIRLRKPGNPQLDGLQFIDLIDLIGEKYQNPVMHDAR